VLHTTDLEIVNETVSIPDAWIRQRTQLLLTQKSSTRIMPLHENYVVADLEIDNENCVTTDSEISSDGRVVFDFALFFVRCLHSPLLV
jgi:Rps23 Pro-64 3,4-dihydroxylase Tpa1-like proline 4-hydroxylase